MGVLPQVPDSQVTTAFGRRPNCHTLRHQWPLGWRPIQSLHQGPTQKSPRALSVVREVRQIRRAPSAQGRVSEKAQRLSAVQPNLDKASAVRLWAGQPQSAARAQHSQPAPRRRGRSPSILSPLGPRQWHAWPGPGTGAATAQILLPVSWQRLHAPNEGLPGNKGHQGQDVLGTTS
jgi:hypothetical protein